MPAISRGRTRSQVPVARRLIGYRRKQFVVLIAAGAALSCAVVGVLGVHDSARGAIRDSVRADQAGRSFAVQGGEQVARDVLSSLSALEPVADTRGDIVAPDLQVSGPIRTVRNGELPLGALIAGRRPANSSEISVTRATAASLDTGLGSTVRTRTDAGITSAVTVVGITVDPADVNALGAVVVDPDLDPGAVTVWLSDTAPYSIPSLQSTLDQRLATYQSVEILLASSEGRLPNELQDLRYAGWGLAALLLLFLATALTTMVPVARKDAVALQAAGMPGGEVWAMFTRLTVAAVVIGQVIGASLILVAMVLGRVSLSQQVGQYWLGVQIPWAWVVGLPVLIVALGVTSSRLVGLLPIAARLAHGQDRTWTRPSRAASTTVLAGCVLLVVSAFSKIQEPPGQLTRLAPVGAALLALGLPGLLLPITLLRMPPASRIIAARLAGGLHRPLILVGLIVTVAAVHAAQVSQDTTAFEQSSQAPQPAGSLLINEMPDSAALALFDEYAERGGRIAWRFSIPIESQTQLRVTGPELVACVRQSGVGSLNGLPESCFPQSTASPVNTVGLSTTGSTASSADPGLVQDGTVGVLQFVAGSGQVNSVEETSAVPDTALGGNLPGLVVSPDSDIADRFDLRSGGTNVVALVDFTRLSVRDRAAIRASVARLAPGSATVDASGDTVYQRQRAVAGGQALAASALAFLLLVVGAVAVLITNRRTVRVLLDIGATRSVRRRFAVRWALFPLVCCMSLLPVIVVTATISSIGSANDIGYLWAAPSLTTLAVCLLLVVPLLRSPPRIGE